MERRPTIKALIVGIYVPTVIFAIGEGAILPFIVLGAQELGAAASVAGVIFASTPMLAPRTPPMTPIEPLSNKNCAAT